MRDTHAPIPLTLLTGFLGAGKTTLLRQLLAQPDGLKLGVLINDFGEININSALVVEGSAESISLSNGCVCCSIQTELVDAIRSLVESRPDLDRIIVEASGVSRSLPLADTMISDELKDVVTLDGAFCLVDAASFPELDYVATELAIDQITGADLIVLNKTDLVSPEQLAQLKARLSGLMPHLRVVSSVHGGVPRNVLFGLRAGEDFALATQGGSHSHDHHAHGSGCDCGHEHDHHHHDDDEHLRGHTKAFASCSWRSEALLDESRIGSALRKLGIGLLRAKGILRVLRSDGSTAVLEFQQVGKRSHLSAIDKAERQGSAVVAIGLKGQIDPDAFTALLDRCRVDVVA